MAPCAPHTNGNKPPCGPTPKTPKCVRECQKAYSVDYEQDLHFGK